MKQPVHVSVCVSIALLIACSRLSESRPLEFTLPLEEDDDEGGMDSLREDRQTVLKGDTGDYIDEENESTSTRTRTNKRRGPYEMEGAMYWSEDSTSSTDDDGVIDGVVETLDELGIDSDHYLGDGDGEDDVSGGGNVSGGDGGGDEDDVSGGDGEGGDDVSGGDGGGDGKDDETSGSDGGRGDEDEGSDDGDGAGGVEFLSTPLEQKQSLAIRLDR